MAKTRSRRGARRNLTRRGGGKGNGGMEVEGSKARGVKAKPYNYSKKLKTKRPLTKEELIEFIEKKLEELEKTHPEPYVTEEEVKEAELEHMNMKELVELFKKL